MERRARSVPELVEQAVRRWHTDRRVLEEQFPRIIDRRGQINRAFRQQPMISIARDEGAFGCRIGELVAAQLGYRLYDREIVEAIAETAHARDTLIESLDERLQDRISNWIGAQFGMGHLSDSEYLRGLFHVLLALGQHGEGVVIGRGAEWVLDPDHTLRVRIFAPFEVRTRRVATRRRLGAEEAAARVRRVDADRREYIQHHFKHDRNDFSGYDVVLNTSTLSVEACVGMILLAFEARFSQRQPRPAEPSAPSLNP